MDINNFDILIESTSDDRYFACIADLKFYSAHILSTRFIYMEDVGFSIMQSDQIYPIDKTMECIRVMFMLNMWQMHNDGQNIMFLIPIKSDNEDVLKIALHLYGWDYDASSEEPYIIDNMPWKWYRFKPSDVSNLHSFDLFCIHDLEELKNAIKNPNQKSNCSVVKCET